MARRRAALPPESGSSVVMPRHLVQKDGLSGEEYRLLLAERREWLRAQGIDPGDWSQFYPVLKASWAAYGMDSALDRARRRLVLTDPHGRA